MTGYNLSYDRKEVRYTLTWDGETRVYGMPMTYLVWDFISVVMDPGDTLRFLPTTE